LEGCFSQENEDIPLQGNASADKWLIPQEAVAKGLD
jgi:hypothetical protein